MNAITTYRYRDNRGRFVARAVAQHELAETGKPHTCRVVVVGRDTRGRFVPASTADILPSYVDHALQYDAGRSGFVLDDSSKPARRRIDWPRIVIVAYAVLTALALYFSPLPQIGGFASASGPQYHLTASIDLAGFVNDMTVPVGSLQECVEIGTQLELTGVLVDTHAWYCAQDGYSANWR